MKPSVHPPPGTLRTGLDGSPGRRRACLAGAALLAAWAAACQSPPAARPPASASPWTPAQQAGLRALGFEPVGEDWVLNLYARLLFEFDSDLLMPPQRTRLVQVGRELQALEVPRLRLEGHTDARGEAAYNRPLALRRARSLSHTLNQAGWPPQRMQVQGFGADRPIADNASDAGRTLNRRVVLIAAAD